MTRKQWTWIGVGIGAAAIAVVAIVLVAGGGSGKPASEGQTAPLTGLPDPDGVANHRPAITVNFDKFNPGQKYHGLDKKQQPLLSEAAVFSARYCCEFCAWRERPARYSFIVTVFTSVYC